jgi:hypothetical protein
MKKIFGPLLLLTLAVVSITSCKKIKEKLFTGIDVTVPDVILPVPAIPIVPPIELSLGTVTMKFNLDSSIRANTGGVFNVSDIKSIKVKQYVITIPDGDANNNLANFQTARVTLSSNSNNAVISVADFSLPDVQSTKQTLVPTNPPELITYLKGSELYYTIYGRVRRTTSKPLTLVASALVRVE